MKIAVRSSQQQQQLANPLLLVLKWQREWVLRSRKDCIRRRCLLVFDLCAEQAIGDIQLPRERKTLVAIQFDLAGNIGPPAAKIGRIKASVQKLKQVCEVSG